MASHHNLDTILELDTLCCFLFYVSYPSLNGLTVWGTLCKASQKVLWWLGPWHPQEWPIFLIWIFLLPCMAFLVFHSFSDKTRGHTTLSWALFSRQLGWDTTTLCRMAESLCVFVNPSFSNLVSYCWEPRILIMPTFWCLKFLNCLLSLSFSSYIKANHWPSSSLFFNPFLMSATHTDPF